MKVHRSFFTLAFVSLMFLGLFVLGTPVSGFAAGTPHTCPGAHQAPNLGGVNELDFIFRKVCPPDTSAAVQWKFFIYNNDTNILIDNCQWGPFNIPPSPPATPKHCGPTPPLPHAPHQIVKVVINYKTSLLGGWMTHTELYSNTP